MRTVFFDIDTQLDFLLPAGALYVPGAEKIIPAISRLAKFANAQSIPVISTVDAHSEDDAEFVTWKPHCVVGTIGQQKPLNTLLSPSFIVSSKPLSTEALRSDAALAPQIQLEKQHTDCFTNPNLDPLLRLLNAERYVVYGVVAEICVQQAVLGLLQRGSRVELVTDAVRSLDQAKGNELLRTIQERGGALTTLASLLP